MAKEIETKEDREGWCQSCRLCFNIDDDGVQIVLHPRNGSCLIVVEGKAHSLLMGKDWDKIRRRMDDENHARAIDRYDRPDDEPEGPGESPEDLQTISMEDFQDAGKLMRSGEVEP